MVRVVIGSTFLLLAVASLALGWRVDSRKTIEEVIVFASIGIPFTTWGLIAIKRRTTAARIYWWNLKVASDALFRGEVPPSAQIQYLLAFLIIELFSWGVDTQLYDFEWNSKGGNSDSVELALLFVKVLGPVLAYTANGGRRGPDFLLRFFVLSFPARVRSVLYTLALALAARFLGPFASGAGVDVSSVIPVSGAGMFWLSFSVIHYTLLALALQRLGQRKSGLLEAPSRHEGTVARVAGGQPN